MAAIVATTAVIAITVGLGVGLGTKKTTSKVSSASSAMTLEECLKEEEASWSNDEMSWLEEEDSFPIPTYEPTNLLVKDDLIPAPSAATYVPTPVVENFITTAMPSSGSTPTVSTEVTGPPTRSSRDEAGEREISGRDLLRGGDAQSRKVGEKVAATSSKPRVSADIIVALKS